MVWVSKRTEDGASLTLTDGPDGMQELAFKAIDESLGPVPPSADPARGRAVRRHVLAEYDSRTRLLKTFPITTKANSPHLFEPKYGFPMVALEDQPPLPAGDAAEGVARLEALPTGFMREPFDGLGLVYPLRYIMQAFEDVDGVEGVVLCKDVEVSRRNGLIRLPLATFDSVRRAINRAHATALGYAAKQKREYVKSELLESLFPDGLRPASASPTRSLADALDGALAAAGSRKAASANAAGSKAVREAGRHLASASAPELYELTRKVELVTLDQLIRLFEARISMRWSEGLWQRFLTENPFILRLAFGFPVTIFGEQVSVGGGKFDDSGGKLADYVVRSGLMGNVALIEIKRPDTKLLGGAPYRGDVYGPSKELAGSVTQILDQRYRLQQEINQKKMNAGIFDVFSYAVQCLLIAGLTPDGGHERKSLEIYRNNFRDVVVITFDELLAKLVALRDFLRRDGTAGAP